MVRTKFWKGVIVDSGSLLAQVQKMFFKVQNTHDANYTAAIFAATARREGDHYMKKKTGNGQIVGR